MPMETPSSFFSQLYDFVAEGIIAYNPRGNIVYANDEALQLLNMNDIVGQSFLNIFPTNAIREFKDDAVILSVGQQDFLFKRIGRDTTNWPVCASRHLMLPHVGQCCILSFTGIKQDAYNSVLELQDALHQAMNIMDAAARMIGFIIFQADNDLQEYAFNQNAEEFFPHHPDGTIYSLDEFIAPEDYADVFALMHSVSQKQAEHATFIFTSYSFGEPHFYSGWCQANPTKGIDGIIGGFLDITDIIQTATEHQNSSLKLQTAINNCMETMLTGGNDLEAPFRKVIQTICEYFHADGGYAIHFSDKKESVPIGCYSYKDGVPLNTLSKLESMKNTIEYSTWENYFKETRLLSLCNLNDSPNCPISRDIVSFFKFHSIWACRIMLHDNFWGILCIYFKDIDKELNEDDITVLDNFVHTTELILQRTNLLQTLQEERDKAIAAEKAKSFFFASVSHDIRTPLNSIIGFSELLKEGVDSKDVREQYLDNIIFSGNTLLHLINDVLDLAKLEADKMEFTNEKVEIGPLVKQVLLTISKSAEEKHLELIQDTPNLPCIELDRKCLSRILLNFISNAIKFTNEGHIAIHASFQPESSNTGTLTMSVEDTGVGIAEEDKSKLLKPFVQINNYSQTGGTGLGLAICKSIADRMNGSISLESTLGKGSTFTCTFKQVHFLSKDAKTDKAPVQEQKKELSNLSILLADDVSLNLQVLKAILKRNGISDVTCANSGTEAYNALQKKDFDLIITDLWMPDLSGDQLVKKIREEKKHQNLPVYVLTADADIKNQYVDLGFSGVLLKPLNMEKVRDFLNSLHFG